MNDNLVPETESATVLAAAATIVSRFAAHAMRVTTNGLLIDNGDVMKLSVIEERVLSNLQNRIIRAGGDQ